MTWPYDTYLVDHTHKVVYAPIHKVASISLTNWFLKHLVKHPDQVPVLQLNDVARKNYSLLNENDVQEVLANYFKFAFVRHPFSRLVSGYLFWFVRVPRDTPDNPYYLVHIKRMITEIYQSYGMTPNFEKGITFRQFVEFLYRIQCIEFVLRTNPKPEIKNLLDPHFCPQHRILQGVNFDLICQLEKIEEGIAAIRESISADIPNPLHSNKTKTDPGVITNNCWDQYSSELQKMDIPPSYEAFLNTDIIIVAVKIYYEDFVLYGYEIDPR